MVIKEAKDCTAEEIARFKKILIYGGQVGPFYFQSLIENNLVLLFYPDSENIPGIGALKINKVYRDSIFKERAETEKTPTDYPYELGWVVAVKKDQGIGSKITKKLASPPVKK